MIVYCKAGWPVGFNCFYANVLRRAAALGKRNRPLVALAFFCGLHWAAQAWGAERYDPVEPRGAPGRTNLSNVYDCDDAALKYYQRMLHRGLPSGSDAIWLRRLLSSVSRPCRTEPAAGAYVGYFEFATNLYGPQPARKSLAFLGPDRRFVAYDGGRIWSGTFEYTDQLFHASGHNYPTVPGSLGKRSFNLDGIIFPGELVSTLMTEGTVDDIAYGYADLAPHRGFNPDRLTIQDLARVGTFYADIWHVDVLEVFTIASDGSIAGGDISTCGFNGQLTQSADALDPLEVALTVSACPLLDGDYHGMGWIFGTIPELGMYGPGLQLALASESLGMWMWIFAKID